MTGYGHIVILLYISIDWLEFCFAFRYTIVYS